MGWKTEAPTSLLLHPARLEVSGYISCPPLTLLRLVRQGRLATTCPTRTAGQLPFGQSGKECTRPDVSRLLGAVCVLPASLGNRLHPHFAEEISDGV